MQYKIGYIIGCVTLHFYTILHRINFTLQIRFQSALHLLSFYILLMRFYSGKVIAEGSLR